MAIEHIYFRVPISVQTILPVITHDRIVAENDLPFVILQFLIRIIMPAVLSGSNLMRNYRITSGRSSSAIILS